MHIRGIILEGYSNAGKTSLLQAIKQYQSQDETAERSVVILGEHYSQILHHKHGEYIRLSQVEHLQLLSERVSMLENLNHWATQLGPASRRSRGLFFVLERFHLNHRAAFPNTNNNEIITLEKQLAALGAKCVLLTISPEVVEERIKSREPDKWINKTDEEVKSSVQQLLETQSMLRQQATLSEVPTIELNTDEKDWANYAKLILEDDDFSEKI